MSRRQKLARGADNQNTTCFDCGNINFKTQNEE